MLNIKCSMLNTQPMYKNVDIEYWAFDIGY